MKQILFLTLLGLTFGGCSKKEKVTGETRTIIRKDDRGFTPPKDVFYFEGNDIPGHLDRPAFFIFELDETIKLFVPKIDADGKIDFSTTNYAALTIKKVSQKGSRSEYEITYPWADCIYYDSWIGLNLIIDKTSKGVTIAIADEEPVPIRPLREDEIANYELARESSVQECI
jgi:hypothetical protein